MGVGDADTVRRTCGRVCAGGGICASTSTATAYEPCDATILAFTWWLSSRRSPRCSRGSLRVRTRSRRSESDSFPYSWIRYDVDEMDAVSTDEGNAMARRLAREEAIFGGTSSGANVVAALRVARRLGQSTTVGTIIIDSAKRAISARTRSGREHAHST